jgi:hypothetical protein
MQRSEIKKGKKMIFIMIKNYWNLAHGLNRDSLNP